MASYEWKFGLEGSGQYFTITYENGTFTVTSLEGSFDINALWFANSGLPLDSELEKNDKSLNMNGANEVWENDGNSSTEKFAWDGYIKLSNPGLGEEGEAKETFLNEGDSYSFSLADLGLDPDSFDPENTVLGVRATSVGGEGGDSIKWVDKEAEVSGDEPALPDLRLVIGNGFNTATPGNALSSPNSDITIGAFLASGLDDFSGYKFTLVTNPDNRFSVSEDGVLTLNSLNSGGAGILSNDGNYSITVKVEDPLDSTKTYFETFTFKTADGNNSDTISGTEAGGDGSSATPTVGDDLLFGFTQGDSLTGGSGDDALFGGNGDDTLIGGAGDDQLFDGAGNDLIIGGDGGDLINLAADGDTDILVYSALSEAGDTVNGFDSSAPVVGDEGGDIIDLADLLAGGDFDGTTLAEAITGGYVELVDNAGNAEVWVDLDGSAGGGAAVLIATLNGVDLGADVNALNDNIMVS